MKLILTGASGFIGGALVDRLINGTAGMEPGAIRALVSGPAGIRSLAGRFPGLRTISMQDPAVPLHEAFSGCDTFLHAGWSTVPSTAEADPLADLRTNVAGGVQLIEAAAAAGVRRIVFLSSGGTVYGEPLRLPIPEEHPTDPMNSYGAGKLSLEHYLAVRSTHHGIEHVILRPSNVYGRSSVHGRPQGVVEHWMMALIRSLPQHTWNDPRMVRDYLFIDDLLDAIEASLHRPLQSHVFNVGTGIGTSLERLAALMGAVTGCAMDLRMEPHSGPVVGANVLDASRIAAQWGVVPRISLEEGLARTWKGLRAGKT